ncbi:NAD(P)/FAD-dependent oxidoreductase [Ferruginibacter profundus]
MKVCVIGGGIIGLSCAYYLQKEGNEVTVIDNGTITNSCSFGNMGYISPSHFVPLATPGIIAQGIKWMLDSSSPFFIKPRMNLDLISWGFTFYKSANNKTLQKNIPHLNNLLQLSRQLLTDFKSDFGNTFSLTEKGCWMLYRNEKTGDHEKHLAEQANQLGLKTITCTAAQVQDYEKEVEVNVAGGVLYLDDCYVDPGQLMRVLYACLKSRGVQFQLNAPVTGFEKTGDTITAVIAGNNKTAADEIVVANGSWIPEISKMLGLRTLLQPGKGYSFNYSQLQQNLLYPSILVDDRVATTPYGRALRIGGTMELSGHNDKILPKRVMSIYNAFKKYYPAMSIESPDMQKVWFGYRPVSPDGMPYIGRHGSFKNLSYAGAHAMLGVSAATGTGKLIAETINHQKTSIAVEAFDPKRFG